MVGKRFRYTKEHLYWLEILYGMYSVPIVTRAFNTVFGVEKTEAQIRSTLKNHNIKCGRSQKKRLYPKSLIFSPDQIEFIRKHYKSLIIADLTIKLNDHFGTDFSTQQLKTFVHNHGINSGRTGCFEKGHQPHNKGVKGWKAGGKATQTQFKPGQRGSKWRPIGSERITKDGIRQRKIADTKYAPANWRSVHELTWEAHHGPVPAGHIVVFNGDPEDVTDLECITRAENMRRNSIHNLPEPLKDVIRWRGVLNRHINERAEK